MWLDNCSLFWCQYSGYSYNRLFQVTYNILSEVTTLSCTPLPDEVNSTSKNQTPPPPPPDLPDSANNGKNQSINVPSSINCYPDEDFLGVATDGACLYCCKGDLCNGAKPLEYFAKKCEKMLSHASITNWSTPDWAIMAMASCWLSWANVVAQS